MKCSLVMFCFFRKVNMKGKRLKAFDTKSARPRRLAKDQNIINKIELNKISFLVNSRRERRGLESFGKVACQYIQKD